MPARSVDRAMADTLTDRPTAPEQPSSRESSDPSRRIDWRRLQTPVASLALVAAAVAAVATSLGTVIAGRVAEAPSSGLIWLLGVVLIGSALVDTVGKIAWVGNSDRAEGQLRDDLLDAALAQPLAVLGEQAVGEILDRVDDDTHEVGNLVRWQVWMVARVVFATVPMWIVAGLTWWPAWLVFPALAAVIAVAVRPLLGEISTRKVVEEMAWTDHAAALEEGIAGRDDLRTSLGQAHVVRRLAELSSTVHSKFLAVVTIESRLARRAGLLLHSLLAAVAISGAALAMADRISVARLVTLFLVTSGFVGQIFMLASHLPDLQAGLGAVTRLRQMLSVVPEPRGGRPLAEGADLELRGLHFSYDQRGFALRDIDLVVPAGQTVALVGRTGSGKSTLASLISRAVEPPRGTVFLGGVDVCDLDLDQLRRAVGVVTQRTEIIAGTLAENIALFADLPSGRVEAAVAELGLTDWVAGLPDGLDTLLGPGGTSLSAGEEQLVAFARLLVREVRVVVLDEATARMDPLTEARVVAAADRLLVGRTGVLIAHRLTTVARASLVAVLDHGRVVQQGARTALMQVDGPFRDLMRAGRVDERARVADEIPHDAPVGGRRRTGPAPVLPEVDDGPSLARGIRARWSRGRWTPTATRGTPTAGSTSPTDSS